MKNRIKNITSNNLFWKTMKPFLNNKCNYTSKICLVHDCSVISDDFKLIKSSKIFFDNAVDYLGIKEHENNLDPDLTSSDSIDSVIMR